MEVGISSACFYPKTNLEDSIKLMNNLGFKKGELFFNCPSEFEDDFVNRLIYERDKYDFCVNSVHGFSSFFEPYLFDKYKRRRCDMLKYFKKMCIAGKRLGAKSYTFHGMRKVDTNFFDINHVIDIYNELIYTACDIGIELSQENVSWCISSNIEFLKNLKEKIKYPLKFTLDIKQGYKALVPIEKYISIMNKDIINVHINDRNCENVCLLPGMGEVDYKKLNDILKKLQYKGIYNMEVYNYNYSSYDEIIKSREYLESTMISNK